LFASLTTHPETKSPQLLDAHQSSSSSIPPQT